MQPTSVTPHLFAATLLVTVAAAAGGAALARGPFTAILVLCLGCAGLAYFLLFPWLPRLFLGFMTIVLLGYAMFGRSFAYLGVPPLFIGELALIFGVGAALASGSLWAALYSPVTATILAFSVWGAVRTVPYLETYGMEAPRDAVAWGYSAFAFTVAACILRVSTPAAVLRQYGRWLIPLVAWLSPALIIPRLLGDGELLAVPGTDVVLFTVKAGDTGVHLAGAAAFVLLGLHTRRGARHVGGRTVHLFWILWLIAFACVTAINRGGFLAIAAALLVLTTFRPAAIGRRVAVGLVVLALGFGALLTATAGLKHTSSVGGATGDTEGRKFSARQVTENVLSIVGLESDRHSDLNATRGWRLEWWSTIVDYTVHGPYFWGGKGFGVNLADDDGFQVAEEEQAPLRSPHNAHLTVLARMGVPGLLLWALLQLTFAASLVRAYLHARAVGALWWAKVDLWVLSYWLAFLVNSSFDVALEGPMAGIWFWSLIGFGVALLQFQHAASRSAGARRAAA